MALYLEITEGSAAGTRHLVRDQFIIGRHDADIVVDDSRVSNQHARIEKLGGHYFLIDLNSTNGLKIEGQRVTSIELENGLKFQIGRTYFHVVHDEFVDERRWNEVLSDLCDRMAVHLTNKENPVSPFNPVMTLKVIRGPQLGQEWAFGYGPRQIGGELSDIRLFGVEIEQWLICQFIPQGKGCYLEVVDRNEVKINGAATGSARLQEGDEIEIGSTCLKLGSINS